MQYKIPCHIMRGGTSKGVFILEKDLPSDEKERNKILLEIMGSPDIRQIDGLGGATSVTSKIAIIAPSKDKKADIDYTFVQVSVDKPIVSYKGNCGNISSAVGPYAIEMGFVKAKDEETHVRVFNTNTNKIIEEVVKTPNRQVTYKGNFNLYGVPGTAAPIKMIFDDPSGSVFKKLLPTNNASDILYVEGFGEIKVSIVDAGNPLVFVNALDLGLKGSELPHQIEKNKDLLKNLEKIRGTAAIKLGLINSLNESSEISPTIPKLTIVSNAQDYTSTLGKIISKQDINIVARMMSMQHPHETYALTGAICTVCAALIPDTIVNNNISNINDFTSFKIGHPGGIIEVGVDYENRNGKILIHSVYGYRTAKMIMEGKVIIEK